MIVPLYVCDEPPHDEHPLWTRLQHHVLTDDISQPRPHDNYSQHPRYPMLQKPSQDSTTTSSTPPTIPTPDLEQLRKERLQQLRQITTQLHKELARIGTAYPETFTIVRRAPGELEKWVAEEKIKLAEEAKKEDERGYRPHSAGKGDVFWQTHAMKEVCLEAVKAHDDDLKDLLLERRAKLGREKAGEAAVRNKEVGKMCVAIKKCSKEELAEGGDDFGVVGGEEKIVGGEGGAVEEKEGRLEL